MTVPGHAARRFVCAAVDAMAEDGKTNKDSAELTSALEEAIEKADDDDSGDDVPEAEEEDEYKTWLESCLKAITSSREIEMPQQRRAKDAMDKYESPADAEKVYNAFKKCCAILWEKILDKIDPPPGGWKEIPEKEEEEEEEEEEEKKFFLN